MELFVHRRGAERIELVEVEETVTVREAVRLADGESVSLEDTEEIIDVELTVAEVGIRHRGHVHINRCRRVNVAVHFNGEKSRDFPPSATVHRVFEWAVGKDGFDLPVHDRPEHVLQICDSTTRPDPTDHVGSFANDECHVCFRLVPKVRFEG